ncbi:hypothetical protein Hanom_Chr06g00499871 [Helianthus anomalus]
MHMRNEPSFFLTNRKGAPQGEGARRYGARATGVAPVMRSIRKSIDRGGGGPGKSSGKTSGKSHTTRTSLMNFPLPFSSTTWAKKAKYRLRKYLFA